MQKKSRASAPPSTKTEPVFKNALLGIESIRTLPKPEPRADDRTFDEKLAEFARKVGRKRRKRK
jgi:hypothetical protein